MHDFLTDKSFKEWVPLSDKALAEHIGAFVRHHRMLAKYNAG